MPIESIPSCCARSYWPNQGLGFPGRLHQFRVILQRETGSSACLPEEASSVCPLTENARDVTAGNNNNIRVITKEQEQH